MRDVQLVKGWDVVSRLIWVLCLLAWSGRAVALHVEWMLWLLVPLVAICMFALAWHVIKLVRDRDLPFNVDG